VPSRTALLNGSGGKVMFISMSMAGLLRLSTKAHLPPKRKKGRAGARPQKNFPAGA
jgi:hypothetical protein